MFFVVEGNRAVLIDRDGTLLVDRGYMHDPSDIRFLPGALDGLRKLMSGGYLLVLITNQSGIGRGYFTVKQLATFHSEMAARMERKGVRLDGIYFCPHHPRAGCGCRKPGTKLFIQAVRDFAIDPRVSFVMGDRAHDVLAGHFVGIRTILVRRKYFRQELDELVAYGVSPDKVVRDLDEAGDWITSAARGRAHISTEKSVMLPQESSHS